MAQLTNGDKELLARHQIDITNAFDATGLSHKEWSPIKKRAGKEVAFGTSPCRRAGHRLRSRSNHCVRCDPRQLAHQTRAIAAKYAYIAASKQLQLIKIGSTKNYNKRESYLNSERYGGASDWTLIYVASFLSGHAHSAEKQTHRILKARQVDMPYSDTYGRPMYTRELFKVNASRAAYHLADHPDMSEEIYESSDFDDYDFCGDELDSGLNEDITHISLR